MCEKQKASRFLSPRLLQCKIFKCWSGEEFLVRVSWFERLGIDWELG